MSTTVPAVTFPPDPWSLRPVVGKFRIVNGVHSEGHVPGTYRVDAIGVPMGVPRMYYPKEVVASRSDLEKHNLPFGEKRVERVDDSIPDKYDAQEKEQEKKQKKAKFQQEAAANLQRPSEDLESLTVPQLGELAKAEGIELDDTMKKKEMIAWIKESREG